MVSIVIILTIEDKEDLLFGWFFWNRCAFQLFMNLDVFANFFFGLFVLFANTLGFSSVCQVNDAKGYDHCPADSDDGVHFLSFIMVVILACMARAQNGCGKFQPTNAPTAIQNMMSNIFLSPYISGCGGCDGAPKASAGAVLATDAPNAGTDVAGAPNAGAGVGGAPKAGVGGAIPPLLAPLSFSCVRPYAAIPNMAPMAM